MYTRPSVFITGTKLAPPHGTTGTGRNSAATSAITSLRTVVYFVRTHARAYARAHRCHQSVRACHDSSMLQHPDPHRQCLCFCRSTHHCQTAQYCCALTTAPQVDVTCLTSFPDELMLPITANVGDKHFNTGCASKSIRYSILQRYTKS